MPSVKTTLTENVPTGGIVTIPVRTGAKTLEVGGYPQHRVEFSIAVKNVSGNVWPTTAEVVLSWEQ